MEFVIEILKTVVLGIIQGITEWLPISSTGHMILADAFLNLNQPKEFMDMFYVVIQLGSILAVVVLYFQSSTLSSPSSPRRAALHLPALVQSTGCVLPHRRHRPAGRRLGHRALLHPNCCRRRADYLRRAVHPAGKTKQTGQAAHPFL